MYIIIYELHHAPFGQIVGYFYMKAVVHNITTEEMKRINRIKQQRYM